MSRQYFLVPRSSLKGEYAFFKLVWIVGLGWQWFSDQSLGSPPHHTALLPPASWMARPCPMPGASGLLPRRVNGSWAFISYLVLFARIRPLARSGRLVLVPTMFPRQRCRRWEPNMFWQHRKQVSQWRDDSSVCYCKMGLGASIWYCTVWAHTHSHTALATEGFSPQHTQ